LKLQSKKKGKEKGKINRKKRERMSVYRRERTKRKVKY